MIVTRRRPSFCFAIFLVALGACGSAQPISDPPPSGGDDRVSPAPETAPPTPLPPPAETAPVDTAPASDAGTSNIDYLLSQPIS